MSHFKRRLGWTGIAFDFRWEKKPGLTGLAQLVGDSCGSAVVVALMASSLFAGCSSPVPSEQTSTQPRRAAPGFVNRVWSVQSSNAVAAGQLYVFLSEGTLVIASPNGTPALGRWTQQDQAFTMIEEGIAYPVEILELTQDRFRIRMRNPGEPVEMTLVPAAP
jgi:hypothetical protein